MKIRSFGSVSIEIPHGAESKEETPWRLVFPKYSKGAPNGGFRFSPRKRPKTKVLAKTTNLPNY